MDQDSLKILIKEAESTEFTDMLLRIIFQLSSDIMPTNPAQKEVVDMIEDIICYLNIKSQIED
jgi:hypothetical protein